MTATPSVTAPTLQLLRWITARPRRRQDDVFVLVTASGRAVLEHAARAGTLR